MPIPVIAYAIGEIALTAGVWAWRGYRAYDAAQTAKELAEMAKSIAKAKEDVGKHFKDIITSMSDEVDKNIATFALVDSGGNSTVSRRGDENKVWKEYIERKLPFRPAISVVCKIALASPITVPRRIRKRLPGDMVETSIDIKLKQTTASIMFETIDSYMEWRCPLKAEPNYSERTQAAFLGTPSTRPKRLTEVFPFWPRPRGSLAPDLVIVEYRHKPFEIDNVFAAVEIKFPNDWVQSNQMRQYVTLMSPKSGADKALIGRQRLALLRVPEDCVDMARDKESNESNTRPKTRQGKKR